MLATHPLERNGSSHRYGVLNAYNRRPRGDRRPDVTTRRSSPVRNNRFLPTLPQDQFPHNLESAVEMIGVNPRLARNNLRPSPTIYNYALKQPNRMEMRIHNLAIWNGKPIEISTPGVAPPKSRNTSGVKMGAANSMRPSQGSSQNSELDDGGYDWEDYGLSPTIMGSGVLGGGDRPKPPAP